MWIFSADEPLHLRMIKITNIIYILHHTQSLKKKKKNPTDFIR